MVIGIDASRANRKYKSGTEWYSYYLIRQLAKIDDKNQYILYSDSPLSSGLVDLGEDRVPLNLTVKVNSHGWQEIKSPHHNFKAKILYWPWPFFWTQIRLSIEMVLARTEVLFIPAHTLPLFHPKKSVVTIHDIGFEREKSFYRLDSLGPERPISHKIMNNLIRLFTLGKYQANSLDYLSWSTKFALSKAQKIIAVSNFTKKELMEVYNAQAQKVTVIYHGYNQTLFRKINDNNAIKSVLEKYGITSSYLFYLGRLDRKKNIPTLVNAYAIMKAKYPQIRQKLVLVGTAGFGFDEVNYMIQEFNLNDEVIITSWIPEDDLPYFYNGASALIFPSHYEGFGLPVLQAMACGTPVVTSQVTSIPEVAGKAVLYFNLDDKQDMAKKMAEIILNKNLRQKLIAQGFKRIKDFSWEKCARETLAVLENL